MALYSFIERNFFYTLNRKIAGNMLFIAVFFALALWMAYPESPERGLWWCLLIAGSVAFIFTGFYLQHLIVRPVQAVCVDDRGVPHPASQVDSSDRVPDGYQGELFRCMAGTSMQVTLGSVENGSASFAHGETFACQKGEALVHHRDGRLTCAPQTPERSCNERSLLRRHGAGIKLIQSRVEARTCIPRTRTVTKTVEREAGGQAMVFDGGVGQGVY